MLRGGWSPQSNRTKIASVQGVLQLASGDEITVTFTRSGFEIQDGTDETFFQGFLLELEDGDSVERQMRPAFHVGIGVQWLHYMDGQGSQNWDKPFPWTTVVFDTEGAYAGDSTITFAAQTGPSQNTDAFIAPSSGRYLFSCSFSSYRANMAQIRLMRNGVPVLLSRVKDFGSTSVYTYLQQNFVGMADAKKGDRFWIELTNYKYTGGGGWVQFDPGSQTRTYLTAFKLGTVAPESSRGFELFKEIAEPNTPASGTHKEFYDASDGYKKTVDSSGNLRWFNALIWDDSLTGAATSKTLTLPETMDHTDYGVVGVSIDAAQGPKYFQFDTFTTTTVDVNVDSNSGTLSCRFILFPKGY